MTGEQKESFEKDDDLDVGEYVVNAKNGGPKLLEEIERVIEGLHKTEVHTTSVEQFDSILYNDMDDGFNWTSSIAAVDESDKLSYEANKNHQPIIDSQSKNSDENDSDVSEWTQDFNRSGSSGERNSFHNSQAKCYSRSESLELVPADDSNRHRHFKRQASSSCESSTYKYQITLYIQMQLCNSSTLADWIKHRNRNCIHFDAQTAFDICGQIVNGLSHVQ